MTHNKPTTELPSSDALAQMCIEICEDRQATDIHLYDVRNCSLMTDFYLICSATSEPHIRAICATLDKELSQHGVKSDHVDGTPGSRWIVVDYGGILVHVFHPELRDYYQLESLWEDAEKVYDSAQVEPQPESKTETQGED